MNRTCTQKLVLWRLDEALWTSTNGSSRMDANKTDRLPVPAYTIKCLTIGDRIILTIYVPASRDPSSHAKYPEMLCSVGTDGDSQM